MHQKLPVGFFNGFDIRAYRDLVLGCPEGGLLVEVGAYYGRSLCACSEAILERRLSVVAVDIGDWQKACHKDLPLPRSVLSGELSRFGLAECTSVLWLESAHAAQRLRAKGLMPDLVFLDADHRVEGVLRDIALWYSLLHPDGWIAGHDYMKYPMGPPCSGVKEALDAAWPGVSLRRWVRSTVWGCPAGREVSARAFDFSADVLQRGQEGRL